MPKSTLVRIDPTLAKHAKFAAALKGITLYEYLNELLRDNLKKESEDIAKHLRTTLNELDNLKISK